MNAMQGVTPEQFDLIVIGSGEASKLSAWDFASRGWRVAVIERHYIGGACPNVACLPSKNIVYTAQVASYARRLRTFGLEAGNLEVRMENVRERKREMVRKQVQAHLDLFQKCGAELIPGEARFSGPKTVEVRLADGAKRLLQGDRVLIGTGSHALIGDTPGLRESMPLTHVEALELDVVPRHLVILGGGYVGLEFAQAMRHFGSAVTIVEHNGRLLHHEDEDVSEAVTSLLTEDGIRIVCNARVLRVEGTSGGHVTLSVETHGRREQIDATHILVAAGRQPNTHDLNLEAAGVAITQDGTIKVNEKLETTAEGIWAAGDVAGSPKFTHVSKDDYRVFRADLLGEHRSTRGRLIPYCLFLEPELARVGLGEAQARRAEVPYRLFKIPMAEVLRAQAIVETRGFMKALVADDDTILGFLAFGFQAGEVMTAVQFAMIAKLPYTSIRDAIIAHPTMAEGLQTLFSSQPQEMV